MKVAHTVLRVDRIVVGLISNVLPLRSVDFIGDGFPRAFCQQPF